MFPGRCTLDDVLNLLCLLLLLFMCALLQSPLVSFAGQLLQKAAARMAMRSSSTSELKLGGEAGSKRKRKQQQEEEDDDDDEEDDHEEEDGGWPCCCCVYDLCRYALLCGYVLFGEGEVHVAQGARAADPGALTAVACILLTFIFLLYASAFSV